MQAALTVCPDLLGRNLQVLIKKKSVLKIKKRMLTIITRNNFYCIYLLILFMFSQSLGRKCYVKYIKL